MTKTRFYLIQTSDCQKVVCNRTARIPIRILQIIQQSSSFFLTGIFKEFWWDCYGLLIKWFMLVTSFFLPYPKLFVNMKQRHQKFWSTKFAPRLNKQTNKQTNNIADILTVLTTYVLLCTTIAYDYMNTIMQLWMLFYKIYYTLSSQKPNEQCLFMNYFWGQIFYVLWCKNEFKTFF